jgi:hypothetical protein
MRSRFSNRNAAALGPAASACPIRYGSKRICAEGDEHVEIGEEICRLSAQGHLMPAKKGQKPPDFRHLKDAKK